MFKLLTEEGIEKVLREYNHRRAVAILIALLAVLLVTVVGLFPSYALSTVRESEVKERTRSTENIKAKGDEKELENWLIETKDALRVLSPALDVDRPSKLISKVSGEKTGGVRITSFVWRKDKGQPVLSVRGIASNRQALIIFKDNLAQSGDFSNVELPISDLATGRDIDFQIRLVPTQIP